jgi:hypothetical protein
VDVPDVEQWTLDRIFNTLSAVRDGVENERATISMNNQRLIDLRAQWDNLIGPPAPGAIEAINSAVARQARIAGNYREFGARFADLAQRLDQFLRDHGMAPSGFAGLGALGQPILIPVAIITGALVALAFLKWLQGANNAQTKAIGLQERAFNARVAGKITDQDFLALVTASEKEATAATPSDPWGVAKAAEAIFPLAIVGLVILLAPSIIKLLESGKREPQRAAA